MKSYVRGHSVDFTIMHNIFEPLNGDIFPVLASLHLKSYFVGGEKGCPEIHLHNIFILLQNILTRQAMQLPSHSENKAGLF